MEEFNLKLIRQTKLSESLEVSKTTRDSVGKAMDKIRETDGFLDDVFDKVYEEIDNESSDDLDQVSELRGEVIGAVDTLLAAMSKLEDLL